MDKGLVAGCGGDVHTYGRFTLNESSVATKSVIQIKLQRAPNIKATDFFAMGKNR